jgi:carbonic anhydrase/acetyltransferase-like protein (isoleucine patch superfamily)
VRALIVETGRKISPFEEAPPLAHFAGTTMGEDVRASLARRGFEIVEIRAGEPAPASAGPTIVLADHTYVSDKCLGDFLAAALFSWDNNDVGTTMPIRLALARTPAVDFVRPVSSAAIEPFDRLGPGAKPLKAWRAEAEATERVAYDCFLIDDLPAADSGAALLESLRARAARVVVKKRELGIPLRLPVLGDAKETRTLVPVTSTVAAHVEHWVHVLWLNQLAFGIRWMDIVRAHKLWVAARLLAAFPFAPLPRIMRSFVRKGRGVRVHPTAHVEASILGDGVVVGPRASVRNSILGAGVEVGDHATVLSSSLGDRTFVTPRTFVVWSAAYPDAVISNYKLQVSLLGRGASLSTWAGLIDAKLQGSVDVKHDGALVSTERSFIGSCIGHGAFVGAKVLVMPGREIPNGAFIAMRPDELIVDVPRDLPAGVPLVRHEGTLVPLERLLPPAPGS